MDAPLLELHGDEGRGRGDQDQRKLDRSQGPGDEQAPQGRQIQDAELDGDRPDDRAQQERVRLRAEREASRSDRTARAWPSCRSARVVDTIVCHGRPAARAPTSRARQTAAMVSPTCCHNPRAKIDSVGVRCGRRMASRSTGSSPSAIAGSPSVTRLIQRICTESRGTRHPPGQPMTRTATAGGCCRPHQSPPGWTRRRMDRPRDADLGWP